MSDFIEWLKRIFSGGQSPTPTYRPPRSGSGTSTRQQHADRPLTETHTSRRRDSMPGARKRDQTTYHPSTAFGTDLHPAIQFRDSNGTPSFVVDQDVKDLADALTGAPLRPELGLYQCQRCKVFYQTQSYELVQRENGGSCVSCLQTGQIKKVSDHEKQRGRNVKVNAITLDNYRQYMGHMITFDGDVCRLLESKRGGDYAVMFENKTWTRGFKMMVFRDDTQRVGGAEFLRGLRGHHLRVRGLLINKGFGDEIVVNDPAMILEVR